MVFVLFCHLFTVVSAGAWARGGGGELQFVTIVSCHPKFFSNPRSTHPGDGKPVCAKHATWKNSCDDMRQRKQYAHIRKSSLPARHIRFPSVLTSLDLFLGCKSLEKHYKFDCWGCTSCEAEYKNEGERSLV